MCVVVLAKCPPGGALGPTWHGGSGQPKSKLQIKVNKSEKELEEKNKSKMKVQEKISPLICSVR